MHESSLRFLVWRRGSQLAHPPAFPGVFAAAACGTAVPRCSSCPLVRQRASPASRALFPHVCTSDRLVSFWIRCHLQGSCLSPPDTEGFLSSWTRQHLTRVPRRSPHPSSWCASCFPTSCAGRAEGSDALTHSVPRGLDTWCAASGRLLSGCGRGLTD